MTHALDSENSVNEIQDDIDKISERIKSLALALNVSKCKYQIISLSTVKLSISISLNNTGLEQVQEYKYLGVDVDDKFTFSNQTTRVSCKANLYAIEAWYPPYMKDRVRIERVVKYAARLVSNKFSSELQYDTLLDILNWKPLYRQVAERRLLLIKKYIDRTRFLPEKVFPIIPPSSSRFSQRLRVIQNRHNCILELRRKHRNKLEDSLCASQMRRLWNSLDDVTIALGFDEYKRKIQSVEQFSCSCERGLIDVVCVCVCVCDAFTCLLSFWFFFFLSLGAVVTSC
jgi:hypothetical protein